MTSSSDCRCKWLSSWRVEKVHGLPDTYCSQTGFWIWILTPSPAETEVLIRRTLTGSSSLGFSGGRFVLMLNQTNLWASNMNYFKVQFKFNVWIQQFVCWRASGASHKTGLPLLLLSLLVLPLLLALLAVLLLSLFSLLLLLSLLVLLLFWFFVSLFLFSGFLSHLSSLYSIFCCLIKKVINKHKNTKQKTGFLKWNSAGECCTCLQTHRPSPCLHK